MGQREITLHTIMTLQQQQHEMAMQILKALPPHGERDFELTESAENSTTTETVPNEVRTTQTTSKRMSELPQVEKMLQTMEKLRSPYETYHEAEKIAGYLYDLKHCYILLAQNRSLLKLQYDKDIEDIPRLDAHADIMEERIEKITSMQDDVTELKVQRENLPFWAYKRKRELVKEIEQVEAEIHVAEQYFNSKYHLPLHEVPFEIKRIHHEARFKERELERKTAKMAEIAKELEVINTDYLVQLELTEKRADIGLIENLLSQMEKSHVSAFDNLQQVQAERNLNTAKNKKRKKG